VLGAAGAPTSSLNIGWGDGERYAQSFIPTHDSTLTQLKYKALKTGSPTDNLVVQVRTDDTNKPSSTVVGTADTRDAATLTGTMTEYTASGLSIDLSGGTKYWFHWDRSGADDGSNYCQIGDITPAPYADGDEGEWGDGAGEWVIYTGWDIVFEATLVPTAMEVQQQALTTLLGSAISQFSPQINQQVQSSLLGSAVSQFLPQVNLGEQTVTAILLGSAVSQFGPQINQQVDGALAGTAVSQFGPQINQQVDATLLGSAVSQFGPEVRPDQLVNATLLGSAVSLLSPTVQQELTGILLGSSITQFAPEVQQEVLTTLLGSAISQFSPEVRPEQQVIGVLLGTAVTQFLPVVQLTSTGKISQVLIFW